jgi:putative MATE family efflux protein
MMVTSSYNIVDTIFVGRLGPESIAALTIVWPLMMIFIAISMGTGVGAASSISRRLGAGAHDEANRVAGTTITLAILIGALMTAIVLPNMEALLSLFGATGSVLPLAKSYMSILATYSVALVFMVTIGNIVTAEGNPILASSALIVSAVLNIILDPIFIFGLGPIPAMGVAGAAVATVIGRSTGALILLIYLVSKKTSYQFKLGYFVPKLKILAEIYRVGFASMVRMIAGSATMVVANRVAVSFGVIPLAVRGVLFRASSFAFMPTFGLGQGVLPLVGYNFGANQNKRIGEVITKAGLVSLSWGILCFIAAMVFSKEIISIFNSEAQFLLEGSQALRIFSLAFFTIGIQMILGFFFQGVGKGLPSLVLASARQVIFLLPGLLIFPKLFGLTGLWAAYPVADALSFTLAVIWTGFEFRRLGIQFRLRYKK